MPWCRRTICSASSSNKLDAGREAGPSQSNSQWSRAPGFPQVGGYPRLSSARKGSRCPNRPQLMPAGRAARRTKAESLGWLPRLGSVGYQPLGRCWWLPGWAPGSSHRFRDHLRRWPHCRAMAGWSGMSVAEPLATGGRPADRPRDPQRSRVPGAFALPHLTDWNGRNRDKGTGRVVRVSRLDAFDRRRRGYGGDCAHSADMGIM